MKQYSASIVFAALLACIHAQEDDDFHGPNYTIEDECGIYLADTIDANTGKLTMGVFAGRFFHEGSIVGLPDLIIPLLDLPTQHHDLSPEEQEANDFWWLWDDQLWDPEDVGGQYEGTHVRSAAMGIGSLARGSGSQANTMMLASKWNDFDFDRARDVGAGAFSYYNGASVLTLDEIQAGAEIMLPHTDRPVYSKSDEPHHNGMSVDDPRVQDFWRKYDELQAKHGAFLSAERREQLWTILQESVAGSAGRLLPKSWTDADTVSEHVRNHGGRSIEWLQKNGICMDNLRQGPSKIAQAGRGAFATRQLKKGQVIAPAPVVHVSDVSLMDVHQGAQEKQLLMNYCFSHSSSSKLLCPLGASTGFINHSKKPNAELRWSEKSKTQWIEMSVEEVGSQPEVGLILEYVAKQTIKKDEEITIDYGDEWEAAWKEHKKNWQPVTGEYKSGVEYEAEHFADDVRTVDEQKDHPYPSNIAVGCYYEHIDAQEDGVYYEIESFDDDVLTKQYMAPEEGTLDYMFGRSCRILDRYILETDNYDDKNGTAPMFGYTVEMINDDHHDFNGAGVSDYLVVENVPRSAIFFTDMPYTNDQSLAQAFRHPMNLPDDLFPQAWRNKR